MEKGGWLDQLLLAVLNFLNQPWLGITVALVGSFFVAFLARRSPKGDWEFIREGPDRFLMGAFIVLGSLKSIPRLVLPTTSFVCDKTTVDPVLQIPTQTHCHFVSSGPMRTVVDYTLGDMARDFFVSLLESSVWALVGGLAGLLAAIVFTMVAGPNTTDSPHKD